MVHLRPEIRFLRYALTAITLSITVLQNAYSQDTTAVNADSSKLKTGKPNVIYNCWVFGNDSVPGKVRKGFIHSTADSGIVFSLSSTKNNFLPKNRVLIYRDVFSIDKIKIRRNKSVQKGILIGAGAGFLLGGILGLSGIPDYGVMNSLPPAENAAAGGLTFFVPGMVIGGVIGSLRIKIQLNKDRQQYEKYRKVIASYSYPANQ